MSDQQRRVYDFGAFHLDALKRELLRAGQPVKLYPKEFDILLALVERAGELVTKDELLRIVWPDASVEEGNLTTHVSHLRKLLGDGGSHREYIVTVPGRGYQFVAALREPPTAVARPPAKRSVSLFVTLSAAVLAAIGIGVRFSRPGNDASPQYQQLTFRRGIIASARFAPDGRTVVYGGAWDSEPTALFLTRAESPESQPLGLRDADVLSISPSGELAVSLGRRIESLWVSTGTLAQVPLAGGAAREILGNVKDADWAPDGKALAVVRRIAGRDRLEFPIGKVLYESDGYMIQPRVSRSGDRVAFLERAASRESVGIVNLSGEKHTVAAGQGAETGLAWSASGEELIYTIVTSGSTTLHAVTPSGNQRLLTRMPGEWKLHDISGDGRALLTRDHRRSLVMAHGPGDDAERDLSWLDRSVAVDLSRDGSTVLLTEIGAAGGESKGVYVRKMDGSPAVRLGDGQASALSPDGKWVIATQGSAPERLVRLPTGAGQPTRLNNAAITDYSAVKWLDSRRIVFGAVAGQQALRQYTQDTEGGDPRPVEVKGGVQSAALSANGEQYIGTWRRGLYLFDLVGTEPRLVPGSMPGDRPMQMSDDGRSLFVLERDITRKTEITRMTVHRIDLAGGQRQVWKAITIPDPAGVMLVGPQFEPVLITPDGASYVYSYMRVLSDLYLVRGLQ
jgi:DNA-binding winged helix-turn-helix (wHTH) protein